MLLHQRHALTGRDTICWFMTSALISYWRSLINGLSWASQNLPSSAWGGRSYYVAQASIACLLASHCSGWFSRPNDDHKGWRDAYHLLNSARNRESSVFLLHGLFSVNNQGRLWIRESLPEDCLYSMLQGDYHPIEAPVVEQQYAPRGRSRRVYIDVTMDPPRLELAPLSEE